MIEGSYRELSARLNRAGTSARVPLSGTIEVTRRCSLHCAHCYNNLPMSDQQARDRELSAAEFHRVLDQIVDAGCLWLLFTGGEIFARQDLLDIYRHAASKGLIITLFSNATLVTEAIAAALAQQPPFSIEVTLYGATERTYEQMTGVRGSFARCRQGIDALLDKGLPVGLKAVATRQTRHEIEPMRRLADQLGCSFKFDALINARVDRSPGPLATRLKTSEVVALDLQDPQRQAELARFAECFVATPPHPDKLYHCGGGLSSFAIDPYGNLSLCLLSEHLKYDLRRGSFAEGWQRFVGDQRAQPASRRTKCSLCQLKSLCGMCPAAARLEHGDQEEPIDFYCRVAHLRAYRLGFEFSPHGECEYCPGGSRFADLVGQTSPATA